MATAISIGAVCALCVIAIFGAGAFTGWKLRGIQGAAKAPPPLTKEQERRVEEARRADEAFQQLQNYDINAAYGIQGGF